MEVRRAHRLVRFRADYGSFKSAIIGQESGGRYGVQNAQGSGAMGIGQVMPATAKVLAERIGLPFRPDLMGGTSPQAKQYQDAITEAAAKEAWQAGGGNTRDAAMYYHGGSNRQVWGPKTRRYADEVLARIGGR
jgi:soluble lytic murein transglycosylase-like protein